MHVNSSGMVRLPEDLNRQLRDNLRKTEGDAIADAPISMLLRYLAALAAGLEKDSAIRYLFPMPRGSKNQNYPRVLASVDRERNVVIPRITNTD